MNKAKIIAHLSDPATLFNTSYEELKTLALQYPYSANFKYLMLNKSRLDDHPEQGKNLRLASIYSIDRSFLRRLMSQEVTLKNRDELLKSEDVLELKDPKKLALDIEQLKGETLPFSSLGGLKETTSGLSVARISQKKSGKEEVMPKPFVKKKQKVIPQTSVDISNKVAMLNKEIESLDFSQQEALDKLGRLTEEINQLLSQKSKEVVDVPPISKKPGIKKVSAKNKKKTTQKKAIPTKKEREVEDIATRSIEKKETMASETLAMILAKQGLIVEAIEMYEQLILTFPKKKAFFAAKINSLKK